MKKNTINVKPFQKRSRLQPWIFPACVAGIYLILLVITPDRAWVGLQASWRVLIQAALPLLLAFGMMFF